MPPHRNIRLANGGIVKKLPDAREIGDSGPEAIIPIARGSTIPIDRGVRVNAPAFIDPKMFSRELGRMRPIVIQRIGSNAQQPDES